MKIKHFAGYGCVNAVRIPDKTCDLRIKVSGDHERGLSSYEDVIYNWLYKRFKKNAPNYYDYRMDGGIVIENFIDWESCEFIFKREA